MPGAEPAPARASVERCGDGLRFVGAMTRAQIAALWRQAMPQLEGVHRFDLVAVSGVDSAGVALLAELAARCGAVAIDGVPPGLAELRAAYRLAPALTFASA